MGFVAVHVPLLIQVADDHVLPDGVSSIQEEADYFSAQMVAQMMQVLPDLGRSLFESYGLRIVGIGGIGIEDQPDGPVREQNLRWKPEKA